jgi:hypothetical protein
MHEPRPSPTLARLVQHWTASDASSQQMYSTNGNPAKVANSPYAIARGMVSRRLSPGFGKRSRSQTAQ